MVFASTEGVNPKGHSLISEHSTQLRANGPLAKSSVLKNDFFPPPTPMSSRDYLPFPSIDPRVPDCVIVDPFLGQVSKGD